MRFIDATTPDARAQLLGARLSAQRLQLNLSQQEAARRAGISRDAVQRAEQGRGTVDTLLRLLGAYGLADRLELLIPEPEPELGPVELLAAARKASRQRARRPASGPPAAPPIWGDDTP